MAMRRRRNDRSATAEMGLSLVEVLVSTCIVIVSIAGVANLFVVATRASVEARHATFGVVLAAQKMEELRAASLQAEAVDVVEFVDGQGAVLLGDSGSPRAVYERRWTIDPFGAGTGLVVITITVRRRAGSAATGEIRLTTLQRPHVSEAEEAGS
jgi:type II secretory pathway pseudopilin PulG